MVASQKDRPLFQGHVDTVQPDRVVGWAWNKSQPDQRVSVELLIDGKVQASVRAEVFRRDLVDAGIGDGCHGFSLLVPEEAMSRGRHEVRVRFEGTETELDGTPAEIDLDLQPIEYFAGDIVDNCNLRCPFCLVDYTNIRTTHKMSRETFQKWIDIMPLVRDGRFFISCLHEPTLHPELFDFIDMIPVELRKKVFFTTNICKPLKDEQIQRLATSGLSHINISMDTLDEELFGILRKGGRQKIFLDNLQRIVPAFKASNSAPELRYITMAYRTNLDEIPGMVSRAFEEFHAARHEVRYTYNVRHITEAFRQEHFLSRDDWTTLDAELAKLPHAIDVILPPDDYESTQVRSTNYWMMPDEEGFPATVPERPIALRGAWDGEIRIRRREEHFSVNVNILENPAAFFRAI